MSTRPAVAAFSAAAGNLRGAVLLGLAPVIFTAEATLLRISAPVSNEAQIVFFRSAAQLGLSVLSCGASVASAALRRGGRRCISPGA